ncbi:MAG TPA: hypothetical protein VNH44_03125 [Micropepsaceae bacterium]|nr:hypothetical protein [Micropepsaceae bacterium]
MRPGAFFFLGKWAGAVRALGETGMGYTVVSIALLDGRRFDQALIDSGYLSRVRGLSDVPFCEDDITEIKQTDSKWNWGESP